jgi:hypothetical protein
MKKIVKFLVFALVTGFLVYFLFFSEPLSVYASTEYGIEVGYPKGWSVEEISRSEPEKLLRFSSSSEEWMIAIENLPEPLNLEEYTRLIIQEQTKLPKDVKIYMEDATLSGYPARRAHYYFIDQEDDVSVWGSQMWCIKDMSSYMVIHRKYFGGEVDFDYDVYQNFLGKGLMLAKTFKFLA